MGDKTVTSNSGFNKIKILQQVKMPSTGFLSNIYFKILIPHAPNKNISKTGHHIVFPGYTLALNK